MNIANVLRPILLIFNTFLLSFQLLIAQLMKILLVFQYYYVSCRKIKL